MTVDSGLHNYRRGLGLRDAQLHLSLVDAHRAWLREYSPLLAIEVRADKRHRLSSSHHHDSLTTHPADILRTRS